MNPEAAPPPLQGIRVIEVYPTLTTAMATQFLGDCGADVVMVEPPGGTALRHRPGWPALARGKCSVELDLRDAEGRNELHALLCEADIVIESTRPGHSRIGLSTSELRKRYPQLIDAAITGWGTMGPWRDIKGYEALVAAKIGMMHAVRRMQSPPRSSFISVPYASYGAAHACVQGVLAALLDREATGVGQHVETDLVRGLLSMDAWNWFGEMVFLRWPDAYQGMDAWGDAGEPRSPMLLALLTAPTKDGHWLQFAQVSPALFKALLDGLGVSPLLADPRWKGFPNLESAELRREFWGILIERVREHTLAEWQEIFESNSNLSAELFRGGPDVLSHPQLVHDGRVLTVDTPSHGKVAQPSTLLHRNGKALSILGPPPALGQYRAATPTHARPAVAPDGLSTAPPLAGITVVEFGEMFAAPYGASLLADLGARVVKVESMSGDQIRNLLPFPEAAGAKVMQGKESIQVDLHTREGQSVAHRLLANADIVINSFRAGVVDRLGIDEPTVRAINPRVVYLSAPGYGIDGPYGNRPAYAPSIGAASGLAFANVPDIPGSSGTLDDIMAAAPRLTTGSASPEVQADGIAATSVASAMLIGLIARERHGSTGHYVTTMLGSATHALLDWVVDYPQRMPAPRVDADRMGFHALYRQYPTTDGWVFLAAPQSEEWSRLTTALGDYVDLAGDTRLTSAELRSKNDAELQMVLTDVFAKETAPYWEELLTRSDIGCVVVSQENPNRLVQSHLDLLAAYAVEANSPIFDEHFRMAPLVTFGRSATSPRGGCTAGQHTTTVLRELGYSDADIAALRSADVIAGD